MHEIMQLKENLMQELGEYARTPKMTVEDVMVVKAMSSAVDHLCNILMAAEEEEGMSMRGSRYSYDRGGRYSREGGNRYSREGGQGGGGSSYARGRGRTARRDSMGRYSRTYGYSRADGMEELVEDIQGMMGELPPEIQQEAQRFMTKLEQEM